MQHNQRYLARIMVEAATPLRVGSGNAGLLVDQLVVTDANRLPYIPGTSLAGVVRHELSKQPAFKEQIYRLFGFQKMNTSNDDEEADKGQGSRIVFSPALLLAADGKTVHEGLEIIDFEDEYYRHYQNDFLPERDHVKINHKGVATKHAKYEEQLVYKGTRFVFEIELEGTADDKAAWQQLLTILKRPTFRVGAGTRKGFGALIVKKIQQQTFNLENRKELEAYLNISSSLNENFGVWQKANIEDLSDNWIPYELSLTPENFYLFGSGLQDADADETPKTEKVFNWDADKAVLIETQLLIPATSVKGALSHRVAFHYNKHPAIGLTIETASKVDWGKVALEENMQTAIANIDFDINIDSLNISPDSEEWEQLITQLQAQKASEDKGWQNFEEAVAQKKGTLNELQNGTGELNDAVVALFGQAKNSTKKGESDNKTEEVGQRGRVLFSDVFIKKVPNNEKVFNHVAIDRFTGGGIDGALFQEKVSTSEGFTLKIYVEKTAFKKPYVREAFEAALADLATGNLPLGGHSTKGHGGFIRSLSEKD